MLEKTFNPTDSKDWKNKSNHTKLLKRRQKEHTKRKKEENKTKWTKVVGKQVDDENWKKKKTHKRLLSSVKFEHREKYKEENEKRKEHREKLKEEEENYQLESAICRNKNIIKGNDKEETVKTSNSWFSWKSVKSFLNSFSALKSLGSIND